MPPVGSAQRRRGRGAVTLVRAVILVLAVVLLGLGTGVLPNPFADDTTPTPASVAQDPWPEDAYTPGELTRHVTILPDGGLKVVELLVFDAGPRRGLPVSRYVGRVEAGRDSDGRRFVDPTWPARPRAVEVLSDRTTRAVAVTGRPLADTTSDPNGREWRFLPTAGSWSEGRHAIRLTYRVGAVHTDHDTVVVPAEAAVDGRSHIATDRLVVTGPGPVHATCYHPSGTREGNGRACGAGQHGSRKVAFIGPADDYSQGSIEVSVDETTLTGTVTPLGAR